jgi:multicomponent Na+:H+ antiporter subunit B
LKILQYILLLAFCGVFMFGALHVPPRGDLNSPVHWKTNPVGAPGAGTYYIQHAYKDDHTPNMVTVVLADYRGFDTMGETGVVFCGCIACFFILSRQRRKT